MNKFILTLNFLLKQNLSLAYFIQTLKTDKRQRTLFIIIAILLAISLPSFGVFIYLYVRMYDVFASLGQESFYIVIAILLSTVILIVFGLFQVTSYFYFSDDVKILTPLPIKTRHILLSKFMVIYIWELLISVFTVLPFFIIYGIKSGIDFLAWVNLVISFILLPIIPLVVIAIIVVLIMKFTNVFKNKDAFRMVGMLAILILIVSFQMYIQSLAISAPEGKEAEYLQNILTNNQYLLERVSVYYPIITLVINSILGNTFLRIFYILLYFLISVGSIYLLGYVLESVYLKTYLTEQEQMNKKRKIKNESNKSKRVAYSIMSIDMKTMFRVPIYALNCLSIAILIPAILLITALTSGQLSQLESLYEPNKYTFWFICSLALALFGPLNVITSTSFSREGKTNWIMRTLPIPAKEQIQGRVLSAILVNIVFTVVTISIILFVFKAGILLGVLSIILSIVASIPLHLSGLYIDLKHPLLKWDNPQVAVKQNLNVLIVMAVSMIYGTIMVLLFLGFNKLIPINSLLTFFILYLIYIVINFVLTNLMYSILNKQFDESLIVME